MKEGDDLLFGGEVPFESGDLSLDVVYFGNVAEGFEVADEIFYC